MGRKKLKEDEETKSISVRIPAVLKEEFLEWCEENCVNFSMWVRKKMKEELENGEK